MTREITPHHSLSKIDMSEKLRQNCLKIFRLSNEQNTTTLWKQSQISWTKTKHHSISEF